MPTPTETAAADPAEARAAYRALTHELRTPLNAIIGFSEVLSNELYGPLGAPEYRDYANIVADSGRRLLALIDDLLLAARPDLENAAADLRAPEPRRDAA